MRLATTATHASSQDDGSSNKLPQMSEPWADTGMSELWADTHMSQPWADTDMGQPGADTYKSAATTGRAQGCFFLENVTFWIFQVCGDYRACSRLFFFGKMSLFG